MQRLLTWVSQAAFRHCHWVWMQHSKDQSSWACTLFHLHAGFWKFRQANRAATGLHSKRSNASCALAWTLHLVEAAWFAAKMSGESWLSARRWWEAGECCSWCRDKHRLEQRSPGFQSVSGCRLMTRFQRRACGLFRCIDCSFVSLPSHRGCWLTTQKLLEGL